MHHCYIQENYLKFLGRKVWKSLMSIQKKRRKNDKNTIVVIRSDVQQYPNVCLIEAIKSKLDLLSA